MPISQGTNTLILQAALLFFLLEFVTWGAKSISTAYRDFNAKFGLNILIVFQGLGSDILLKAYRAARGTATSRVVQSHVAECSGHLLNYVLHASAFFIFGGYGNQRLERCTQNGGCALTSEETGGG